MILIRGCHKTLERKIARIAELQEELRLILEIKLYQFINVIRLNQL